jgi:MYXO-CTERM domain-containing protein
LAVDLVLNDTPVAIGPNVNNGPAPNNQGTANNGGGPIVDPDADPETPDIPTASEAICGCESLAAPARGWPWALAGLLGLFLARRGLG